MSSGDFAAVGLFQNIKCIAVGKLPVVMQKICDERSKQLGIRWTEVPDVSDKDAKTAVRRESDMVLERIDKKDYVVLFDLYGKKDISAVKAAMSRANPVFVIGGSNGFDERVKMRANVRISLSDLTYPHALFRLTVLELFSNFLQ